MFKDSGETKIFLSRITVENTISLMFSENDSRVAITKIWIAKYVMYVHKVICKVLYNHLDKDFF